MKRLLTSVAFSALLTTAAASIGCGDKTAGAARTPQTAPMPVRLPVPTPTLAKAPDARRVPPGK